MAAAAQSGCPFGFGKKAEARPLHTQDEAARSSRWWPHQLDLKPLRPPTPDPAAGLSHKPYAEEFLSLDLDAVKADIMELMVTSQDWWPADYGHYGPFFIRMAWHSAGTYRMHDGRGGGGSGMLRFAPLNSWPDNGNLDKARRLLWPIKQKYGRKLSWADLMIFTGNCALESMGLQPFGFGGGREDQWEPEEVNWGEETEWLAAERGGLGDQLHPPLGAVQMGLIYVNPEGPGGHPDPLLAAHDIRTTFGRMAMNDEETVALIAGGHTFGKGHGAAPDSNLGQEPEGASVEMQGLGWFNRFRSGKGADTITSGLEGAWTAAPTRWDNGYFEVLLEHDWVQTKTPAGATLWIPKGGAMANAVPDAHIAGKRHAPVMFTTDLALKMDPAYGPISQRFRADPDSFADAFSRAWFKLTHRDMGPVVRYLGAYVPQEELIWQDPVPPSTGAPIGDADVAELKAAVMACGVEPYKLVRTAWASASTYRRTDHRGGANGARIRLSPQNEWEANDPSELTQVLDALEDVRRAFNVAHAATPVSLADLVVLAGGAAIEEAAAAAGHAEVVVPFTPGRTDALEEQTDAASFAVLEPVADGFRNYLRGEPTSPESLLVEKAYMLTLTSPEMAVLVAGLRVLDANAGHSQHGVFTDAPGTLTNDFFVNLLDMATVWIPAADGVSYEGRDRATGKLRWTGSRVDLIFGSNSELRAIAEYYACDDSAESFLTAFVAAWTKVMDLDRFDQRVLGKYEAPRLYSSPYPKL